MNDTDQYLPIPMQQQPDFHLQPPTPITSSGPQSTFTIPSTSPVPIPSCSRPTSRGGTPASSLSRSASRHHPYGASPASFASSISERSFRPRSATNMSDRSEWESEASAYETDGGSKFNNSPEMIQFASLDFPFLVDATLPQPPLPASIYPSSSQPSPVDSAASPPRPKAGKNGKSKKSHARKTAPGHIKRPPNAFILFRSHCCGPKGDPSEPDPPGTAHARHLASLDINNSQHVSLIVSQIWKGMKPADKAYWEQKAKAAKEEHQRLYPEYRYKPQTRPKETIRKRKKVDPAESREHRDACHEVARIVLEHEGEEVGRVGDDFTEEVEAQLPFAATSSATGRGRANLMEEVLDGGGSKRSSPKAAKPTKRANRRNKAKEPVSDDSSPPSFGLPTPPALFDTFSRSAMPPYPSVLAGSEHAHFGPHSSPDYDNSPFAFMAQLERDTVKSSVPSNPFFALDPQFGLVSSTVDGQALHPLSRPSTTSAPATHYTPSTVPPATAIGFSRPPSPTADAIRQMQSYSLNGPSPPSRPSTSIPPVPTLPSHVSEYSFGTYLTQTESSGPTVPLAQRRDIALPPNLPLSALKQRRGTLRPGQTLDTNARGDLMLISPLTATFSGRRQSIGWNTGLRRVSLNGLSGTGADDKNPTTLPYRKSSLSTGVLADNASFETLTFPQDVLESFPVENPFTDADFLAAFGSSHLPLPEEDVDNDRPGTASSSWSTDDSESIERLEGGFPSGYFDRRRSTLIASKFSSPETRSPEYHVDSTRFFSTPDHPLSSLSLGSHSPQPAVPAFGSAEFGGSFQPFAHPPPNNNFVASALPTFSDNATPTFLPNDSSNQFRNENEEWTSASMKDTALSILQERRNPTGSHSMQDAQPAAECEYVLLPFEQLGDTELMTKLHQQGYGIAFETGPLTSLTEEQSQLPLSNGLPSGATMSVDDSRHLFSHSLQ
ncbi:uncharacterized protein JCM6883_006914 [Sporobolomyces salmoneus]|uniref:uncharacterized protein n=1 Tax=Sporobolomyces salmoneus TaxID=183962 RepID=UPI00317BD8E3